MTTLENNDNTFGIRTWHKTPIIRMMEETHKRIYIQKHVKYNLLVYITAIQRNKYISALKRVK